MPAIGPACDWHSKWRQMYGRLRVGLESFHPNSAVGDDLLGAAVSFTECRVWQGGAGRWVTRVVWRRLAAFALLERAQAEEEMVRQVRHL